MMHNFSTTVKKDCTTKNIAHSISSRHTKTVMFMHTEDIQTHTRKLEHCMVVHLYGKMYCLQSNINNGLKIPNVTGPKGAKK